MITPAKFSIFITTVNTMIGEAYSVTPTMFQEFCTTVPVDGEEITFGWTGMLPKYRLWYGPRVTVEPAPQTYNVSMLPYELTMSVDRFRLDDDKFGIYYRMLPDMARQGKRLPDLNFRDLIEASNGQTGARQNGLDGLTHWNTAHPINLYNSGLGTYSNDFTGGGMNVTYSTPSGTTTVLVGGALSPTAFATLWEYQSTLKGEDGESLDVTPNKMMIAPQLKTEAEYILHSTLTGNPNYGSITGQVGTTDNPLRRFGVEYVENKLLKFATTWYLTDTTKAVKPFVRCLREAVQMVPRINENDPSVFDNHRYLWGGWAREAPAWSYAWLSARSGP